MYDQIMSSVLDSSLPSKENVEVIHKPVKEEKLVIRMQSKLTEEEQLELKPLDTELINTINYPTKNSSRNVLEVRNTRFRGGEEG